jgi:hypothetical protein
MHSLHRPHPLPASKSRCAGMQSGKACCKIPGHRLLKVGRSPIIFQRWPHWLHAGPTDPEIIAALRGTSDGPNRPWLAKAVSTCSFSPTFFRIAVCDAANYVAVARRAAAPLLCRIGVDRTRHHGLYRDTLQGGCRAGLAQGRQECEGCYRAEQPDGTCRVWLWYSSPALFSPFARRVADIVITEHMYEMLDKARKHTIQHYRNILQTIHEKPSVIAQTYKDMNGKVVVSMRPLYLCLQCPTISTEAERDLHVEEKLHCFCG